MKNKWLTPLFIFLFIVFSNIPCHAQYPDQIVVVPGKVSDPTFPHIVHENARITLKAILRNTTGSNYSVSWDVNQDGYYDPYYETYTVTENTAVNGVR